MNEGTRAVAIIRSVVAMRLLRESVARRQRISAAFDSVFAGVVIVAAVIFIMLPA